MNILRKTQGFTLIELVMVIAIIGILASISVPKFIDLSGAAKAAATKAGVGSLRGVLATKYAESATGGATASFPASVAAADFAGSVDPKNAITAKSGVTSTASAPAGTLTHATAGFWYITSTGVAGAFSDGTVDTSSY